jgi:hypothetical protein
MVPIVSFKILIISCITISVCWAILDKMAGEEIDWNAIGTGVLAILIVFFAWSKYT